MFLACILFFHLLCDLVSGNTYFPLSHVNVTLPRGIRVFIAIPPLTYFSLLDDSRESVSSAEFSLINDKEDDLFFISGRELRINERYFREDFTIGPTHYNLIVKGTSEYGEAFMTVNVFFPGGAPSCSEELWELCFWKEDDFQVAEGPNPVLLGRLSCPLLSVVCPIYSVRYSITKGKEYFDLKKHGAGLGDWSLLTSNNWGLDRERSPIAEVGIKCKLYGGPTVVEYEKTIIVKVIDINDNQPQLSFTLEPLTRPDVLKGDMLAKGYIYDPDGPGQNSLKINAYSENWPMEISCENSTTLETDTSTNISCGVHSLVDKELNRSFDFVVEVTDESLLTGYGVRKKKVVLHHEAKKPIAMAVVQNVEPAYMTTSMEISAFSQRWARLFTPENSDRAVFRLKSSVFAVTKYEGIVYVNDTVPLLSAVGQTFEITVFWSVKSWRSKGEQKLIIKITNPLDKTPNACTDSSISSTSWCSSFRKEVDCIKNCGVAVSSLDNCFWKIGDFDLTENYTTCTSNPQFCPDHRCDSLEQLNFGICPQDCAENVIGTVNTGPNHTGIFEAVGTCSCYPSPNRCICDIVKEDNHLPDNVTEEDIVKTEIAPNCDVACQITLMISSLVVICFVVGIAIMTLKYRRLQKRCSMRPAKEELVSINYEECGRPMQETSAQAAKPDYFDSKWEFPRHRLTIEETIGEGEFGLVLKARAEGIQGREGIVTVAVKTLKSGAKDSELADLISECQVLKEIDNPNVIKLLGVCTTADGPIYMIIEYAELGSLRHYLKKYRRSVQEMVKDDGNYLEGVTPLTAKNILTFAWQIAKGMAYLAEMKLVHRDLAARNVLLTKDLVCKISDFGLSRDIYVDDTYLKRSKGRVPIKWMALESLSDHIYTSKSDVWSYGIVLWELCTAGESPYPGIAAQNLYALLQEGYRMDKPPSCSPDLYAVMYSCWHTVPAHRPSFNNLVAQLDVMLAADRDYLDLNPRAVENREYLGEPLPPQWRFQGYDSPGVPRVCPSSECQRIKRYENEIPDSASLELANTDSGDEKNDISQVKKI